MTCDRFVAGLCDAALEPCRSCLFGPPVGSGDRQHLYRTALRIGAAYDRAAATGDLDAMWQVLTDALGDGRDVLLAWLDFLEEVVQIAERRYGTKAGRGEFKASQVKAAVRRLVQQSSSPSRDPLFALGPGTLDIFLDAVLTVIVGLLNQRSTLWTVGPASKAVTRPPLRMRILLRLTRWAGVVYSWFQVREPLDEELFDEVARIAEVRGDPLAVIDRVVTAARWISEHRSAIEALAELVAIACDEAEYFGTLTGPQKQAYARDLILVVLELQFGIVFRGVMLIAVESIIDLAIDFVVSVNNKRGVFPHRIG